MSDLAGHVAATSPFAEAGYPGAELEFICDTVEQVRPDAIFEWGTGSGCSGRIFWECSRLLNLSATIHTVELPDELMPLDSQHPSTSCGMYLDGTTVIRHRGDGVTEALVLWAHLQPQRSLFFLDGDHSQVMVYREIALIDRMVPDAVMLIHDTNAGPGDAARAWVAEQGRHVFTSTPERVGVGRLDPVCRVEEWPY